MRMMDLIERVRRNDPEVTEVRLGDHVKDLSFMTGNTHVTTMCLWNSNVRDLSPLEYNPTLRVISLRNAIISDLSPLQRIRSLTHLFLLNNNISDISPLRNVKVTGSLDLGKNLIKDISPLSNARCHTLNLHCNDICDLSPLWGNVHLKYVNIHSNPRIPCWQERIIHAMVAFNQMNYELRSISLRHISLKFTIDI